MSDLMLDTRQVRRTPLERLFLWERAYKTRASKGVRSVSARGKTREISQEAACRSWLKSYGDENADD